MPPPGVTNPYNTAQNIAAGTLYFKLMLKEFDGNGTLGLENIICRDLRGIGMDFPLRPPDEFLDDFPNRAQTTVLQ